MKYSSSDPYIVKNGKLDMLSQVNDPPIGLLLHCMGILTICGEESVDVQ